MCLLAVAISTALLVSLLSVAEGIWENASFSILTSKEDIIIYPQSPGYTGGYWGINNGHKISDTIKSDKNNISEVSPMFTGILNLELENQIENDNGYSDHSDYYDLDSDLDDLNIPITTPSVVISLGIIPERFEKFFVDEKKYSYGIMELTFDDWFETPGDPHYAKNFTGPWTNEVLIDDYLANKFDLKKGSYINLSISDNSIQFKVSGIFKTNLKEEYFEDYFNINGIVILHLSEYQSLVGEDIIIQDNKPIIIDNVKTIAISLNENRANENTVKDVANDLQEKYPLLDLRTKEDELQTLEEQNAMTRLFYTAISIVSIIIGLLFVTCIMLISVYERTNEIGMLRAIGISRATIFKWVLFESVLLIILGILIGFLPGYFGSELLGNYISNDIGIQEDLTAFSPSLILWSFIGMLGLGTLISLIPAARASIMKVNDAISFVR
jgi:ABC-type antimicrobial peptide transport system permease subunit